MHAQHFPSKKRNPNCSERGASRGQMLYAGDERDAHSQRSFVPHDDKSTRASDSLQASVRGSGRRGRAPTWPRLRNPSQHLLPSSSSLRRSPCLTRPRVPPLERRAASPTGRMCQATTAVPQSPPDPKPPPTGLTK